MYLYTYNYLNLIIFEPVTFSVDLMTILMELLLSPCILATSLLQTEER